MIGARTLLCLTLASSASLAHAGEAAAQDRSIFSMLDTQARSVAPSMSADGELAPADVLSAGGRRVQVWALTAAPGAELQIDLRSADFDSYLYVVGPGLGDGLRDDDGGDGLNSRLCLSIDQPGEYRVVASSLNGETGAFTLEVTDQPGASNGACPEAEAGEALTDLSLLPTDGRTLSAGDDVSGALLETDHDFFGDPVQAWSVQGVEGQSFSVELRSSDFDPLLYLVGPGLDPWLENDDFGDGCDSRITLTFPETGAYSVVVSRYENVGEFRLVTSEQAGAPEPPACTFDLEEGFDEEGTLEADDIATVGDVGSLVYEQTANGTMTGNETMYEGRFSQAWNLFGSAGDRVAIEVRSGDFDSYMYVTGPGISSPLWNDDATGSSGLHSRICIELPETGQYRVIAAPLSGEHVGSRYTVSATAAGADDICPGYYSSIATLPTEGRSLAMGSETPGALDATAALHMQDNRLIQAWDFDVQEGLTVFVDLVSSDFDAVLYATGPGIGELYADDFGGGCNSRMEINSTETGTVKVVVASYFLEQFGSFFLRASTDPPPMEVSGCSGTDDAAGGGFSSDPAAVVTVSSGDSRRIEIGTEVQGELSASDEVLASGEPAQPWTVEVQAGDELVFELIADDFDPKLFLDGDALLTPLMDDDSAGSLDSRITYTATESGTMRLIVSAYAAGDAGSFRLRVIRVVR